MRGITEEKLLKLRKKYKSNIVYKLIDYLIKECTELNAWQPIDENTPKDRNILVYDPGYGHLVVIWSEFYNLWITVFGRKLTEPPTHWQELPEYPK
jgi:hypothetical protein